jgi:hypothetical protein
MANADSAAIRRSRAQGIRESEKDGRGEPFGMPFTNREVAVIVANELNRHDRGLWFYEVERHIDDKRWIIARKGSSQKSSASNLVYLDRALARGRGERVTITTKPSGWNDMKPLPIPE